LSCDKNWQ